MGGEFASPFSCLQEDEAGLYQGTVEEQVESLTSIRLSGQ